MRKLQIAMIALLLLAASMPAMAQTTIESPEVQRLISAAQSQIARAKSRIGTEKTISWRGVFLRNQLVDFGSFLRGPMTSIMVDEGLYVVTSVPDDQGRIQPVQAEIGFFATAQVARDGITLNFQIAEEESQRVLASWTASLPNSQDFHGMFISDDSGSGVFADFGEPDSMETPREWPGTGRLDQLTFHSGDDGDYFLLNPAVDELTGNYLTIETSGEIDTYIDVFEYNSRATIMSNDDGGNNMNAKVSISTDSLPVILLVRPLSSDTTGAYGLNIANIQYELGEDEPNDYIDQATVIEAQGRYNSQIFPQGDTDFYRISVPTQQGDQYLRVETDSAIDTTLKLYDENYNEISYDDDGGNGHNARVSVLRGGTYYVQVAAYGSDTGPVSLVFSFLTAVRDDLEPNDSFDSATAIEPNTSPTRASFSPQGDIDYYRFILGEAATVEIETTGNIDTYLYLYDSQRNQLATDDDGGSNYNARIQQYLAPGEYWIQAEPLGGDADEQEQYSLMLRTR